jgi:YidC/Oxa1 family membrane protein insertase
LENQNRLFLFMFLSVAIYLGWFYFFPQPNPTASQIMVGAATPVTNRTASSSENALLSSRVPFSTVKFKNLISAASVTIETDNYEAVFANQGAVLISYELKKYPNRQTGQPVQLVNSDPTHPKPFSLEDSSLPNVNQVFFEVEGLSKTLSKNEETQLTFRTAIADGVVLEKKFFFKNGSYLIGFEITLGQKGQGELAANPLYVAWADTLGPEENTGTQSRVLGYRVATLTGDHVDSEGAKKSQEITEIPAPISWTALANQFFVAALIPDPSNGGAGVKIVRDYNVFREPTLDNPNPGLDLKTFAPRPLLEFVGEPLKPGESFQRKGQVFLGPQDYFLLTSLNLKLENVVDFGFFGKISVYMLKLLRWFFSWAHNWGLAIIFLSVAVKLLLWLPTHHSYKSMYITQQKMKELQPKIESLKRKYSDDKAKLNQETTALYQTAGINPLGGCLPMVLQIPVFFALYSTLSHSIELRSASFIWLKDLTLKDPTFVLPLLMGVSMIVQQRVSGQAAAQAAGQQKFMMWFFPIILTVFSFQWPSGLLIYWVVTNLLSIVQQKVVNREIKREKKKKEEA